MASAKAPYSAPSRCQWSSLFSPPRTSAGGEGCRRPRNHLSGGHDPRLSLHGELFYNPGKIKMRAMKKRTAIVSLSLLMISLVAGGQEKPAPTFKIRVTAEQANIR